jgi:hypothetical protein
MRFIIRKLTLLAAALMILAVPALADEGAMDRINEEGQKADKNECLLISRNCANEVDSIQQKIDRIRGEISRGTDVYTTDELRILNMRLEEATRTMEDINLGG